MKLHITKRAVLVAFIAVVALAGLSWWASSLHLGSWEVPVAMSIAAVKVAIVGLVFMELGEHGGGVRVAALTAPVFVALMVLFMLGDVWLR